jgi:uncharacterized protein (TIGR02284 family)
MPESTFPIAQSHSVEKLKKLLFALQDTKKKFELMASKVKNQPLHQTIISLAVENNQYASELVSLIRSLGGDGDSKSEAAEGEKGIRVNEKNMLKACEKCEIALVKTYQEVLEESYLYDSLKKIIRYQLNGVNYAFQKIRLMNILQK